MQLENSSGECKQEEIQRSIDECKYFFIVQILFLNSWSFLDVVWRVCVSDRKATLRNASEWVECSGGLRCQERFAGEKLPLELVWVNYELHSDIWYLDMGGEHFRIATCHLKQLSISNFLESHNLQLIASPTTSKWAWVWILLTCFTTSLNQISYRCARIKSKGKGEQNLLIRLSAIETFAQAFPSFFSLLCCNIVWIVSKIEAIPGAFV